MAQGIETKTGRVPSVAGEGVVDSSLKTRQLQSGLSQLSTSLTAFGKASDARRIQNDIITARTAYALNEEMPGSLAPEAELAYDGLTATRSTQQFFRLLSDDADVYGNGLLTDDENYPDHNSKQAAFEQFIEGSKKVFFDQAQFSPAQQESIIQYVADRSNTFKTEFATLAAKDIKALKKNEASKFIQENIIDRQTRFNQFKTNTNKATQGWTVETHVKESSAFSRDWHEDLKKKLSIANPHLSQDDLDDMIIQQIGLLATDPDNPHPEYLEYFNESGKGGKPAINIIPSLAKNARALYNSARSAFISNNKASITLANKIQTDNENLAHINAQNWVIEEIGKIEGHRNLSKMTTEIRKQFPHITGTKLQSVINWASTLITADKKDGDPKITARLVLQAAGGRLSMEEFEKDPRTQQLNQEELREVQKTITNYSVGKIKENQKVFIAETDSLRDLIEGAVASKETITFAGKEYTLGETERIKFNSLTGKPEGFSPKIQSIMDDIVNQYQDMGEIALYDAKNDDPRDARKELNAIKYQMLRNLGLLDDGNKHKIKTKKVKDSRDYGTSAAELFNSQLAEDTSKEAIASTSSGIEHIFKADVPDDYNPATHVPPTSLFFLDSLRKKSKATPKDLPKTPDDTIPPTPLKSSPEVLSEKDTIVPRDVPTNVPRSTKPVPLKKPLSIPQQRSEAFDQAFPEVPNERNELRKLQDTAEFQDDKTIMDAISEGASGLKKFLKKAFNPRGAEALNDVIMGYVGEEEPIISRYKYGIRVRKFTTQLENGTLSSTRKKNLKELETFLKTNIPRVFQSETTTVGLSSTELIDRMRDIYMGETNLGTNVGDSSTGAIGNMQVLPTTMASVIVQGQFGKNAAKYSNISPERFIELKKIAKEVNELVIKKQFIKANQKAKPLAVLLSNKEVNFMAATAKMLQYLKAKKDRG
jgi:hypothetical protein